MLFRSVRVQVLTILGFAGKEALAMIQFHLAAQKQPQAIHKLNERHWVSVTVYLLACLVAQLVKNLPAMWETWVHYLGWEDPLEKRKATHSSILAWRIPRTV